MLTQILDITVAFCLGCAATVVYLNPPAQNHEDFFRHNINYLCHNKKIYMQTAEATEEKFNLMCKGEVK